jgi:hypothetical protein
MEDETFHYTVNWPSGLSLGEARLRSLKLPPADETPGRWEFDLTLDAAIPSFQVEDHFRSVATPDLCSIEFEKDLRHGKRKANELTTFHHEDQVAVRQTLGGGGKSEIPVPACPKDGLTFLHHVRRELSRGRVPPTQTILFGAPYEVRMEFLGRQLLRLGTETMQTDRLRVSVRGKVADVSFEMYFAVDESRRPVMVRLPLEMGTFSMELVSQE